MDDYEKEYEEVFKITRKSMEALGDTMLSLTKERGDTTGESTDAQMLIEHLVKHMCGFILCALADDAKEREEAMNIIREAVRHADKYALDALDEAEANEANKSTKH
tara:strand:- start:227 stop:544 length:318 start_codon:yes stop_codon:yes gene_type:complete